MASFKVYGLDRLQSELRDLGQIPDEVKTEALTAMATVSMEEQVKVAREMGVYDESSDGKHMIESIGLTKPKLSDDGGSISVTFKGSRIRGKIRTTNAEIAFVNNYGRKARKGVGAQKARPFVRTANKRAEERIQKAGQAVVETWAQKITK